MRRDRSPFMSHRRDDGPVEVALDDTCQTCGGEGGFHDCGDDTCCCADPGGPSDGDWWDCPDCGGVG